MAEIRKHEPGQGNPIAEALRAAMGEPVRPVTPGQPKPADSAPATDAQPANTWLSVNFTTNKP